MTIREESVATDSSDGPADADRQPTASAYGIAALSLLEAIILTLKERGLLTDDELDDAFAAAIDAHLYRHSAHSDDDNRVAASILHRLRVHGNSVRLDL